MKTRKLRSYLCLALTMLTPVGAFAGEYDCPYLGDKRRQTIAEMTQGEDGWFFRTEQDMKQRFSLRDEPKAYFARFASTFKERGTSVVFVPIPLRGILGADYLDDSVPEQRDFDPVASQQSFSHYIEALRSTGLVVPNLLQEGVLDDDSFFRRDHHWTPEGSRATAKFLTEFFKGLPGYDALKKVPYETSAVGTETMRDKMAIELRRLCNSSIPDETYTRYETQRKVDPNAGAAALFGDSEGQDPTVLIGSSFSAVERYNFDGFLSEYSQLEIANHALTAGLLFNALVSYVSSPAFQQQKPPFLIWEAPGNYDINRDSVRFLRQVIPALHGECMAADAIATGAIEVKDGAGGALLEIPAEKKVSGDRYFIFVSSSNKALAKFTLDLEYDDGDGEWFTVDRSEHFNNFGRFFIELGNEVESSLTNVSVRALPRINTRLEARICKVPGKVAEQPSPQS